jgi:hypothetical protein
MYATNQNTTNDGNNMSTCVAADRSFVSSYPSKDLRMVSEHSFRVVFACSLRLQPEHKRTESYDHVPHARHTSHEHKNVLSVLRSFPASILHKTFGIHTKTL